MYMSMLEWRQVSESRGCGPNATRRCCWSAGVVVIDRRIMSRLSVRHTSSSAVAAIAVVTGLLVAAAPAVAAPGQDPAEPGVSTRVHQTPQQLRKIWTPDRLKKAAANLLDAPAVTPEAVSRGAQKPATEPQSGVSADAVPPRTSGTRRPTHRFRRRRRSVPRGESPATSFDHGHTRRSVGCSS
jgi:hypothetical protein